RRRSALRRTLGGGGRDPQVPSATGTVGTGPHRDDDARGRRGSCRHPAGMDQRTGPAGTSRRASARRERGIGFTPTDRYPGPPGAVRSEEHTSELQSRENLVCRLLLEKKKTDKLYNTIKDNAG